MREQDTVFLLDRTVLANLPMAAAGVNKELMPLRDGFGCSQNRMPRWVALVNVDPKGGVAGAGVIPVPANRAGLRMVAVGENSSPMIFIIVAGLRGFLLPRELNYFFERGCRVSLFGVLQGKGTAHPDYTVNRHEATFRTELRIFLARYSH